MEKVGSRELKQKAKEMLKGTSGKVVLDFLVMSFREARADALDAPLVRLPEARGKAVSLRDVLKNLGVENPDDYIVSSSV